MRIVMTANTSWNLLNFRRPIIEALLAEKHTVFALAPADEAVSELVRLGVQHEHLEIDSKGLNPWNDTGLLLRLHRHFSNLNPDTILSWTIKNNLYGAIAAARLNVPFIPNVSGLGTAFLSGALLRGIAERLYRAAFRSHTTVFFQNPHDLTLFVQRGLVRQEQAHLLPGSGIDLDRFAFQAMPASAPSFLMIARLLRDKGVYEYVEAAATIRARNPQIPFRLLGAADSDNRTAISHAQASEWHERGLIEWLGTRDDVRPLIAAAHCLVLPSYREGAPRTLIEGAAMGRPVIATDVPGCRDVMEDGRTGFLCQPRDAHSLAAACERMIDLPLSERARMGEQSRLKMEHEFDESLVVDAYRKSIDKALR